jgi:hypothetical protein
MGLWENLKGMFSAQASKYKTPFLEPHQVNVPYDAAPIAAGSAYCRLWLVEMRLAKGVAWFQHRYPVVYAATQYDYGGSPVTVPYLAGVEHFKDFSNQHLDRVVSLNYPLTPLFPYNRGLVTLQAGLFSVQSDNLIVSYARTLTGFARLLPVPELAAVIGVVEPLLGGIEEFFRAGQSQLELGYQQTFSAAGGGGANDLRAGYFAVVLARHDDFADEDLRVVNDSLHRKLSSGAVLPLEGYNSMLFRIERRDAQDWEALATIKELVGKAQTALEHGQTEAARQLLTAIKIAIARSPDIARDDRKPMFAKIEAELSDLGLQGARVEVAKRSLYQIMRRPMPHWSAADEADWARVVDAVGAD